MITEEGEMMNDRELHQYEGRPCCQLDTYWCHRCGHHHRVDTWSGQAHFSQALSKEMR